MRHFADARFWEAYEGLPKNIHKLADNNFTLLKQKPRHPSLNFKRVGQYWSVRIGQTLSGACSRG
jgi:hypothetical protein